MRQNCTRPFFYSFLSIVLLLVITPVLASDDLWRAMQTVERGVPEAGDHPGNVYLKGECVYVQVPATVPQSAVSWRLLDDGGDVLDCGDLKQASPYNFPPVRLGRLGIGWYCIEFLNAQEECVEWTCAAVLAKLKAPIPQDSPICIDSAVSWFAKNDPVHQERLTRLAALAGMNWVRDRVRWRDIQPSADEFAFKTTYDSAATLQARYGLKVLQVFHGIPSWAVEEGESSGHFPRDLRILYNFCKSMAERFKGRVQAWEPWNEGNAHNFGAHTASEMATAQKAAYLGFKAGDPDIIVGWNAYAGVPTQLHTKTLLENQAWSYFDTYNVHTYDWPHSYDRLWEPTRQAACGRPIWVTEADRGLACETPLPWCDFTRENEIQKAEFMAQSYATSLWAGCNRHFHFILGHYSEGEGKIQFGLLRLDETPRPSYVALAAMGRLLAGAKCLGRWESKDHPNTHIIAFRAWPDGKERDVLVAWAEKNVDWAQRRKTSAPWPLPQELKIECVYDYLGRTIGKDAPEELHSDVVYVVLPPGEAEQLSLTKRATAEYRPASPSSVVLKVAMPFSARERLEETPWATEFDFVVEPEVEIELPLVVYNFGAETVKGVIRVEHLPKQWRLTPSEWEVTVEPMGRIQLPAQFFRPQLPQSEMTDTWINLRGDFGKSGQPVLAFRLTSYSGEGYKK